MSALLFKLKDVPEDEAQAIRCLLQEHSMLFFETSAGRWGISLAAIWLKDETRLDHAKRLIADYERERAQRMQADYAQLQQVGAAPTFFDQLRQHPIQVVLILIVITLVAYFSATPFLNLGVTP